MIRFSEVSFRYENAKENSLKNINFDIQAGEVVLITGLSGSGKSTLLKCINGLIPNLYEGELTGKVQLDGRDLTTMGMDEISRLVGCVFQSPRSQFFTTNTTSELAFAMENYGISTQEMSERMDRLCDMFCIHKIMNRDIFTVSSGERQLLSLACALTLNPKILIFDEPSSNLDYAMTMRMGQYITNLKAQGYTIIVADHRYYYLNGRLDKVLLMQNGELQGIYTEAEFKNSTYKLRSFDLFEKSYPTVVQNPQEELLVLKEVSYRHILSKVNLTLRRGEVLAVVGRNGVGKTTLAKLICKMEKADSGEIQQEGASFFILQDSDYQLFGTSVEHELRITPKKISDKMIVDVLGMVGLEGLRRRHPFNLSGGEKQRLQIATSYMSLAEVVVFDEPTSGLDLQSMEKVATLISDLAKERGVIIISHDYEFIRKVAGRIVFLEDGRIQKDFKVEDASVALIREIFEAMVKENNDEE